MANRQVTFLINARADQFKSAMKSAERTFKSVGRSMERTGRTLSRTVTAPLTIMGGLAVTAAAKFESSFADIRKTVDTTEEQFAKISDGMRELSRRIPTAATELNRIGGVAGQLGVQAENIVSFTETIAKLGDTTDIVGEKAALSLSRFMNIMGTAQGDIDRLGSTIAGLGNNFAAMESEIIEIGQSLAPLGNAIGLTEQQVLAFSGTIAASGGKAQAASTAFQRIGNSIQKAVIQGGKNLKRFADVAGMSASEFQTAFQENAGQALTTFLEGLQKVQDQGGSYALVLEEMGLGTQRLTREVGKVLGNLDDLNRALPDANKLWRENTALTEEAQKRYNTLVSQLKTTWNWVKDVAVTFGNIMTPAVREANTALKGFFQTISQMSPQAKQDLVRISAIIAGIPPLIWGIGKALKGVGKLIALFTSGAVTSFLTFMGVVAAVVGVFTTVVVAGQSLVDNWDKISQAMVNFARSIGLAFQKMAKVSIESIRSLLEFLISDASIVGILAKFGGVDLGELASEGLGLDKLVNNLESSIAEGEEVLEEGIKSYRDMDWTSINDSAEFAFEQMEKGFLFGLDKVLTSTGIKQKINQVKGMFQFIPESDGSGGGLSEGMASTFRFASNVLNNELFPSLDKTNKKAQDFASTFRFISQIMNSTWAPAVENVSNGMSDLEKRARRMQRVISQGMTQAVSVFAEGLGKMAAGVSTFKGVFSGLKGVSMSVLETLANLAQRVGKIAIAVGVGIKGIKEALKSLNPFVAIAAGAALIALGAWAKSSLQKVAENKRESMQASNTQSVNDALVRSDGSIVEFHPDDDILAMRDFSGLATAGGSQAQTITNVLNLDGRRVWKNQKRIDYKRGR